MKTTLYIRIYIYIQFVLLYTHSYLQYVLLCRSKNPVFSSLHRFHQPKGKWGCSMGLLMAIDCFLPSDFRRAAYFRFVWIRRVRDQTRQSRSWKREGGRWEAIPKQKKICFNCFLSKEFDSCIASCCLCSNQVVFC